MQSSNVLCSFDDDEIFGPAVRAVCRGGFDFTLLFEESILSIGVSVLFLVFVLHRINALRHAVTKVEKSNLQNIKLVTTCVFATVQFALLVMWAILAKSRTITTIPAAALSFIDALAIIVLSRVEHIYNLRPSTLLNIYLFVSVITDVARVRTLWLIKGDLAVAILYTCSTTLRFAMLLLEAMEKRHILRSIYPSPSSEEVSGIFNRSVLGWLNPLLLNGFRKILSVSDLLPIDSNLCGEALQTSLPRLWEKCNRERPVPLLTCIIKSLKWPLISAVFPRICQLGLMMSQPFLINSTIQFISEPVNQHSKNKGYGLIGAYGLVYIGTSISGALYWQIINRVKIAVRGSLISLIYSRTLDLDASELDHSAALTLVSTDVETTILGFDDLHEVWANLAQLIIAIWLLELQVSWACIGPILIAIACLAVSATIGPPISKWQKIWNQAIEARLNITTKMLGQMKEVKLLGFTEQIESIIRTLRSDEIRKSAKYRQFLVTIIVASQMTSVLAPVATFALYAAVAAISKTSLISAQAFTSLTLVTLVANPILYLTQGIPYIASGISCLGRIEKYLISTEGRQQMTLAQTHKTEDFSQSISFGLNSKNNSAINLIDVKHEQAKNSTSDVNVILVQNGNFGWKNEGDLVLKDLNFHIREGSLNMIIGVIGCGKSTLLRALLGELPSPWLTNSTVQHTIIGMSTLDPAWYKTVLHACSLDIDIENLPKGDQSQVGSRGVTLSGGQKQRIAIARALYAKPAVALLDDSLSGLDSKTERNVFNHVFGRQGLFRKLGSTVIFASHATHLLSESDHIIVLSTDGRIAEQGSYETLRTKGDFVDQIEAVKSGGKSDIEEIPTSSKESKATLPIPTSQAQISRKTGDWKIYKYYFDTSGSSMAISFLIVCGCLAFSYNFPTLWLQWWAEANTIKPNKHVGMYLGVYFLLAVLTLCGLGIACWQLMIYMTTKSALKLHDVVLKTVFGAPLSFFTKTDTGETTNRFSQDMQLIDMVLPMSVFNTVIFAMSCIVQAVLISVSAKWMSVTIPFLIGALVIIQKYYLQTSRQLRLLDLEAKAPLYSHFIESLSGLVTIRAFQWQNGFESRNTELLDTSQKPMYLLYSIQRWLTLVLDLLVAALAVILVTLAVELKEDAQFKSIGVALINITLLNQGLTNLVRYWTLMETSLAAIMRVKAFASQTDLEENIGRSEPPLDWPIHGAIVFQNVLASHSPNLQPILRDITMNIQPGEHIALCGRTGGGKSSLMLALFQMLDLEHGSITIDGINLCTVSRNTVRSRLNCLTQEPFFIPQTLRANMVLGFTLLDEDIIVALKKVNIWEAVQAKGGLDAELSQDSWSAGQQQLLCFARAMLRKCSVLVIDEASSSVDIETDRVIHRLINTEFKGCTVIAITHKLDSILDFDKVALLDQGVLLEFDSPRRLISESSAFATLYNSRYQ